MALNPAFRGAGGAGPGGSALGLLVWFCSQAPASPLTYCLRSLIEEHTVAGNVPVCGGTRRVEGRPGARTRTHTAGSVPQHVLTYTAQVYVLFTVCICIDIKHKYLQVCTIETLSGVWAAHAPGVAAPTRLLGRQGRRRADTIRRPDGSLEGPRETEAFQGERKGARGFGSFPAPSATPTPPRFGASKQWTRFGCFRVLCKMN